MIGHTRYGTTGTATTKMVDNTSIAFNRSVYAEVRAISGVGYFSVLENFDGDCHSLGCARTSIEKPHGHSSSAARHVSQTLSFTQVRSFEYILATCLEVESLICMAMKAGSGVNCDGRDGFLSGCCGGAAGLREEAQGRGNGVRFLLVASRFSIVLRRGRQFTNVFHNDVLTTLDPMSERVGNAIRIERRRHWYS